MKQARKIGLGAVLLAVVLLWTSGRMTYLSVDVSDDKAGDSTKQLIGAVWDPAVTPLALAMVAAMLVQLAVPPAVRRVIGGIIAILAALASFRSVQLLTNEADLFRAQQILVSGVGTQKANDPLQVTEWAVVVGAQIHHLSIWVALLGAALGVLGGIILAMNPGQPSKHSRYETPESRRESIAEDLQDNPDSSRAFWDALDSGVDPTDLEQRPTSDNAKPGH